MAIISDGAFSAGTAASHTITFASGNDNNGAVLTAGTQLIVAVILDSAIAITSVVTNAAGTPALTSHVSGDSGRIAIFSITATGGETTMTVTPSASEGCTVLWIEDDEVDGADALDTTVAYASLGFTDNFDVAYTAGVPAAGGIAVGAFRAGGGRTWVGDAGEIPLSLTAPAQSAMIYETGIASGSGSLNFSFTGGGSPTGGLIAIFNYAAAGGQVTTRGGIALSSISAINGITKANVSAINGLTI